MSSSSSPPSPDSNSSHPDLQLEALQSDFPLSASSSSTENFPLSADSQSNSSPPSASVGAEEGKEVGGVRDGGGGGVSVSDEITSSISSLSSSWTPLDGSEASSLAHSQLAMMHHSHDNMEMVESQYLTVPHLSSLSSSRLNTASNPGSVNPSSSASASASASSSSSFASSSLSSSIQLLEDVHGVSGARSSSTISSSPSSSPSTARSTSSASLSLDSSTAAFLDQSMMSSHHLHHLLQQQEEEEEKQRKEKEQQQPQQPENGQELHAGIIEAQRVGAGFEIQLEEKERIEQEEEESKRQSKDEKEVEKESSSLQLLSSSSASSSSSSVSSSSQQAWSTALDHFHSPSLAMGTNAVSELVGLAVLSNEMSENTTSSFSVSHVSSLPSSTSSPPSCTSSLLSSSSSSCPTTTSPFPSLLPLDRSSTSYSNSDHDSPADTHRNENGNGNGNGSSSLNSTPSSSVPITIATVCGFVLGVIVGGLWMRRKLMRQIEFSTKQAALTLVSPTPSSTSSSSSASPSASLPVSAASAALSVAYTNTAAKTAADRISFLERLLSEKEMELNRLTKLFDTYLRVPIVVRLIR